MVVQFGRPVAGHCAVPGVDGVYGCIFDADGGVGVLFGVDCGLCGIEFVDVVCHGGVFQYGEEEWEGEGERIVVCGDDGVEYGGRGVVGGGGGFDCEWTSTFNPL